MTLRKAVLTLVWGAGLAGGIAAEDLDDLFQSPPSDIVNSVPDAPPPSPNDPVRPFFRLSSWAAGATDGAKASIYYETDVSGGLDFRPDDRLRVQFTLSTSLPDGTGLRFSSPSIGELFVDYSPVEALTLRVGQYGLTWGQARLVANTGNLVSDVATGGTIKATMAVPLGGLIWVTSAQGPLDSHKLPSQVLQAGSLEQTWGPVTWGLSGSLVSGKALDPVWKGALFARTSWSGADWYAESVGMWLSSPTPRKVVGTLGSLWQGGYPVWTVNAEYQFEREDDGLDNDLQTSSIAISVDTKRRWSFTPKLQWSQDWEDRSGQLTTALVFEPAPHLTVTAGLPWVYGDAGTRFVAANPDPEGRWWALGLKAALAWNY